MSAEDPKAKRSQVSDGRVVVQMALGLAACRESSLLSRKKTEANANQSKPCPGWQLRLASGSPVPKPSERAPFSMDSKPKIRTDAGFRHRRRAAIRVLRAPGGCLFGWVFQGKKKTNYRVPCFARTAK